ncbi:MAG TPA: sigma-70 factor domain-containing protein, partial [Thermomicrobiales bacterium]|nr:sigma-70 factor domain-containing protein [Thermomicrobiales bacterium]
MVQDHLRDVRRVIPDEMEELSQGLERRRGRRGRADVLPLEEEEPSLNEVLDAEEEAEEARTIAQDLDALQRLDPGFVTDPVKLYLREIAQAALLTHEQEIALAKRVE